MLRGLGLRMAKANARILPDANLHSPLATSCASSLPQSPNAGRCDRHGPCTHRMVSFASGWPRSPRRGGRRRMALIDVHEFVCQVVKSAMDAGTPVCAVS
jgi:hypothetical protein